MITFCNFFFSNTLLLFEIISAFLKKKTITQYNYKLYNLLSNIPNIFIYL